MYQTGRTGTAKGIGQSALESTGHRLSDNRKLYWHHDPFG